jgi:hypothetical protein
MSLGGNVRDRSVVAVANEMVNITVVCHEIGVAIPEIAEGKSAKVHCPFGAVYHSDHGMETAFRVYPSTNSAFCFAGCGYFSPVYLYAQAFDITTMESATRLLDLIGYKPLSLVDAWAKVSAPPERIDQSSLAEALKVYCSRIDPLWEERQFDPGIARALTRCLELVPRVRTSEEARTWLETTKQVMHRTLREDTSHGASA